jgi:tRNA-modifying protein YgfZ
MSEALVAGYTADPVEVVWLSGADRQPFLERMSTNRLADLAPGTGRATAVLTDTGRVVDLVACHAGESGTVLITSGPGAAASVSVHLRRYVLFQDHVRVTDATAQVAVVRLLGPAAVDLASQATGLPVAALPPGGWLQGSRAGEDVWALRHPMPGGLGGVDLVTPRGAATEDLVAALAGAGAGALHPAEYARWRVAVRLPAFGAEIDGQTNPLELGLQSVVDFGKGCYIGQEVVARLDSYDKVQRHLVALETGVAVAAGDTVHLAVPAAPGRAAAGRVTTSAPSGSGTWLALALVPTAWPVATEWVVAGAAGVVPVMGGRATPSPPTDPYTGRAPTPEQRSALRQIAQHKTKSNRGP